MSHSRKHLKEALEYLRERGSDRAGEKAKVDVAISQGASAWFADKETFERHRVAQDVLPILHDALLELYEYIEADHSVTGRELVKKVQLVVLPLQVKGYIVPKRING